MCHVLVIEDDCLIAENVADIARDGGATSVAIADSEQAAVDAAIAQRPGIILSDVNLLKGTGPLAVASIQKALGPVPVIFITGTPEACQPCAPPAVILEKPVRQHLVLEAFSRLAPL